MLCPTLADLPLSSGEKAGWPWTEQSPQIAETMYDGLKWPRISIVTPSYNQGDFIEETIRSILLQGYPNLEYLIIDGNSSDDSVNIITRYDQWINYWVSEPDHGQADAVKKGWLRSSGQILGWLNSDDRYESGALLAVASKFIEDPSAVMIYSDCDVIDQNSEFVATKTMSDFGLESLLYGKQMPQPAAFIARSAAANLGYLNVSLQWALDTDFFLRLWLEYEPELMRYVQKTLASSREYSTTKSKTGIEKMTQERRLVLENAISNKKWMNKIEPNYKRAIGHTYIREASLQFEAGMLIKGIFSLFQAWRNSPRYYSKRCIYRLLSLD